MTEPYRLSAEEIRRMHEDGFVVRQGVFSKDECARMAQDVEDLELDLLAH